MEVDYDYGGKESEEDEVDYLSMGVGDYNDDGPEDGGGDGGVEEGGRENFDVWCVGGRVVWGLWRGGARGEGREGGRRVF
jgi:hypothetical protein